MEKPSWYWDGEFPIRVLDREGYVVCGDMMPSGADNARLISAAPDLLEAALLAVSVLGHMARILGKTPEEGTVVPILRAAIAKAKGTDQYTVENPKDVTRRAV